MLLLQALVYLAAGVLSVPIAKRLGLGSVLGYLIAGAIIGPSGLSLVGDQRDVMHFAEFGVVILLFLIGLEVRPALLWTMRSTIFGLGGGQLLATGAVVAAAAMALGLDWRAALACGAILAMSSTAIVLQTLDEKGLRKGPVGTASFGVLLFQDLAVIPLFILLPLLATAQIAGGPGAEHAAPAGFNVLRNAPGWMQALAAFAAVGIVVVGGRYLTRPLFRYIASAQLREIFTASALMLVVGVAALMQSVGLSSALGAFLAGVMLAESEFRRELEADVEPFRGLFLGLFFITVGAQLDFALILSRPLIILGLVLALMVGKSVVMFAVARLFKIALRDAAATAVALCQGGEFAFVLITFVVGARVLGGEVGRLLSAVVALSMMLTPVAFWLYERASAFRQRDADRREPDRDFEDGADVIVAGFGRFGQIAGRLLTANGFRTSVMDASTTQIDLLRRFDRRVNYGDATRLDLLRSAGAEQARVLLVAIDDREKATELVEIARSTFPHLVVLARAWDRRHAYQLLAAGAEQAERETYEASLSLGRAALERLGFNDARARRAADAFRLYDGELFERLRRVWDDGEGYVLAARQSSATLERLLNADRDAAERAEREEAPPPPALDPAGARALLDAYSDGPWPWESG